jgi:hypothetical protein
MPLPDSVRADDQGKCLVWSRAESRAGNLITNPDHLIQISVEIVQTWPIIQPSQAMSKCFKETLNKAWISNWRWRGQKTQR